MWRWTRRTRGAVVPLEHLGLAASGTEAMGMGLPIRFSASPVSFDQPAQALGASNEAVFRDLLRLSESDMQQLRAQGVI